MSEENPGYKLTFILTYEGEKSFTFEGSSSDPVAAWRAAQEIQHLNNNLVSHRSDDGTQVTVAISKDGRPISRSDLVTEVRHHYESMRSKDKEKL